MDEVPHRGQADYSNLQFLSGIGVPSNEITECCYSFLFPD
jgi:hypothetical protein